MVETSSQLVDHVIPEAPVGRWVLSFPEPLRLLFARQPDTLSRCLFVRIRAIETDLIHRAQLTRASRAQPWLDLGFHEPLDSLSAASIR